tara:strand:+ start:3869 stop:4921 length:1053 start_codon:yes stop_codon:yes gene_type:complete
MPYTKNQLKLNEYYDNAVKADRREQIAQFTKEERDFQASGSNAAAGQTLRMKTGELVSIPEIQNHPAQKIVVPNKTYTPTKDADKFLNKDIKELLNNNPVKTLTISEFFQEYNKIAAVIPLEGSTDSHRYLYEQSLLRIGGTDAFADLKAQLEQEIINLKALQEELNEIIAAEAEEAAQDAAYAEYKANIEGRYPNTTVPYTREEWDDKGQPKASEMNGHQKLRFIRHPLGNHSGKKHTESHVYVTYAGYKKKRNRPLRSGNAPVVFSVEAVGDPTLTYEWLDAGTGASIKFHDKSNMVKGEDTATITIEQGSPYHRGWGPTLQCKIRDASGEIVSHKCEVSRRAVWAKD